VRRDFGICQFAVLDGNWLMVGPLIQKLTSTLDRQSIPCPDRFSATVNPLSGSICAVRTISIDPTDSRDHSL
jgi:hypothetical protein